MTGAGKVTLKYATERSINLGRRKNALSADASKFYHENWQRLVENTQRQNGNKYPSDSVLEMLEDRLITWAETGTDPMSVDVHGRGPEQWQEAIEQGEIADETRRLRIREAARRTVQSERVGIQQRPAVEELTDFLAVEDEPVRYRVDGLLPKGGRAILAAQYKAGKSTAIGNVIRCLVDGDPLFGVHSVEPVRQVVLFDIELDPRTIRAWLRDQNIQNTDRVRVVPLRGRTSTFDIMDPAIRTEWAQAIQGADVIIVDPLRPVLDSLGLDENKDAGRFLVAFDAFLDDSGASEAIVVHHMGHNGERSRGDSRLQDWPDVTWKIVREDPDDPASAVYFSAFGRDVNVSESALEYEPATRHLTLVGGSRKDARVGDKLTDVLTFLESSPGTSKTGIKNALLGDSKAIAAAVDKGVQLGLIEQRSRQGRGGGHAYYLTQVNSGEPESTGVPNPGNPGYTTGFRFGSSADQAELISHPGSEGDATTPHCPKHPVTPRPDTCTDCSTTPEGQAS